MPSTANFKLLCLLALFHAYSGVDSSMGLETSNRRIEPKTALVEAGMSSHASLAPQVNTTSGLLTGTTFPEAHAFYSVPYAETPVRFMNPEPISYRGEITATDPDYVRCFESFSPCNNTEYCELNYSEDCLVLNIHVPATANLNTPVNPLPVMVNIHGGNFYLGSGTEPQYEGRWFVNVTNTILVSINYRLGPLGFLAYQEGDTTFNGIQGFLDQQLALRWVQDNIEAFGGDKSRVTIMGNSAGGQSVMLHLVSSNSGNLFSRAIIQSAATAFEFLTPEEGRQMTNRLIAWLNCGTTTTGLDCLRNADPLHMLTLAPTLGFTLFGQSGMDDIFEPFRPVIEGSEFKGQPFDLFQSGQWNNDKRVMLGTKTDENGGFPLFFAGDNLNATSYAELNTILFGPTYGPQVTSAYEAFYVDGVQNPPSYLRVVEHQMNHVLFDCSTRTTARLIEATATPGPTPPVFLYADEHVLSDPTCVNINPLFCGRANHESELPLLYRTSHFLGYNKTEADKYVEDRFSYFWGNFATTGYPDTADQNTTWPAYNEANNWPNIRIKFPQTEIEYNYMDKYCDFWDSIGYFVNVTSSTTTSADQATETTAAQTTSGCSVVAIWSWLGSLSVVFTCCKLFVM